jgi:phosphoribosylaminoimidazole-succinocarboxamide synthase
MTSELLDPVLLQTDFPDLQLHASGKVRDVYQLDADRLLFVATDRISAFDYVLATGIPHKGRVLSQISLFWFDFLSDIVSNHLITADVERYPQIAAEVCRSVARPVHGGPARADVSRRVRGPRLYLRVGLEGVQGDG